MNEVRPVSFPNKIGQQLHGILHEPDPTVARGVCVLLLSPGIKGRVGPHRLYLKIADRLVPLGFHVLRFDYHGLGDSEGQVSERMLADMYNTIHGGRYTDDTIAAMDWAEETLLIRRFVGSGLCGGSISALLAAQYDSRIECLLGIGLPTVLEGGPENWARVLTQHHAASLRGRYVRKLADPGAWLRFVGGKSSYRAIWRIFRHWISRPKATQKSAGSTVEKVVDHTNPRFASAFMAMIESARPIILVFSEADRLRYQFAENFETHHAATIALFRNPYDVHVIAQANHVLSDHSWVTELLDVAERWLVARYSRARNS